MRVLGTDPLEPPTVGRSKVAEPAVARLVRLPDERDVGANRRGDDRSGLKLGVAEVHAESAGDVIGAIPVAGVGHATPRELEYPDRAAQLVEVSPRGGKLCAHR